MAPVVITVYDRYESIVKCINSLLKCPEAIHTDVYISSDSEYRIEDSNKIQRVRDYISQIEGFKSVNIVIHEENKGLKFCYKHIINKALENSDTFIFLEDDIVVSRDFLKFINEGLQYYKNDQQIISISGFSQSVFFEKELRNIKNDVYFTQRWCPWGFGSWKNKFLDLDHKSTKNLERYMQQHSFTLKLNSVGLDLKPSFLNFIYNGKNLELDLKMCYLMIESNLYTVSPYTTKTFNIGNDGHGTRTKKNNKYIQFDIRKLNEIINYQFVPFSMDKINNSFNYRVNDTLKNKFKQQMIKVGLLQAAYRLHTWKKKLIK